MIQFTQYVGDAPGTTTVHTNGLGVCPPGYYGQLIPGVVDSTPTQSAQATRHSVSPYATDSHLSGLGADCIGCTPVTQISGLGLTGVRWDLVALAFGVGFAGILGVALYKRRK